MSTRKAREVSSHIVIDLPEGRLEAYHYADDAVTDFGDPPLVIAGTAPPPVFYLDGEQITEDRAREIVQANMDRS